MTIDMQPKEPIEIQISRIKSFLTEIERTVPMIKKMSQGSVELDRMLTESLMAYSAKINFSQVNPDYMKEWQDHMYFLYQEKGMKVIVVIGVRGVRDTKFRKGCML